MPTEVWRERTGFETKGKDYEEPYLNGLLHSEHGLELGQHVLDVLCVGTLIGDEQDVGQEKGNHVFVDLFSMQSWQDAVQVNALQEMTLNSIYMTTCTCTFKHCTFEILNTLGSFSMTFGKPLKNCDFCRLSR